MVICSRWSAISSIPLNVRFLKTKLKRRFVFAEKWLPSAPDLNPMYYFYWDFVKTKVYNERSGKRFASEAELKKEIKPVWNICTNDLVAIKKAIKEFAPPMKAVKKARKVYQDAVSLMYLVNAFT